MSSSGRHRSQHHKMDGTYECLITVAVKVVYTLDTSPHTMISRVARRVPVRIARKQGSNSLLGRVSLKTCLNAICLASPELLLDKSNDYIVYAVDPEESAPRPVSTMSSPSKCDMSLQVFVGKGFFSNGIAEPGDGTSYVTGQVRLESRNSSAFSSDEEDTPGTQVLEVVLRMKEASQRGREQYQSRMRGIASSSTSLHMPTPAPAPVSISESSLMPTAAAGVDEPDLHAVAIDSAPESSAPTPTTQVLQVLHAMQAHQGSLSQEQKSHLMGLLGMVAGAVQSGALPAPKDTTQATSSSDTPGDRQSWHSTPSPGPAAATPSCARNEVRNTRTSRPGLGDIRTELPRICYNCGTTQATTWRILTLPSGITINHPASERPPSDVVPLTWTSKHPNKGPIQSNCEARWQACNPCGLYFAKYGVARPEYVRNFVARPGKEDKKRDVAHPSPPVQTKRAERAERAERSKRAKGMPMMPSSRTGFTRTLSAVANREAERLQKQRRHDENMPPWSIPLESTLKSPTQSRSSRTGTSDTTVERLPGGMESSPCTVLQSLLSETEPSRTSVAPVLPPPQSPCRNGSTLDDAQLPPMTSPVRRSPRKQPPGTMADVNPYATMLRSASSPVSKKVGSSAQIAAPREALTSPSDRAAHMLPPVNPFMGLAMLDDDIDTFGGPPSPSAGRTSRAKPAPKREIRTPSRLPREDSWPSHLHTSPTALGLAEPLPLAEQSTFKDLFAEHTHDHWLGAWNAPTSLTPAPSTGALKFGAPEPTPENTFPVSASAHTGGKPATESTALASPTADDQATSPAPESVPLLSATSSSSSLVKRPPRRPMPATVEDASSSHSGSPPATSPDVDDSLVDLIEDPYGLLSTCGIGVLQPDRIAEENDHTHNERQGTTGLVLGHPDISGCSVDAFQGIELYNAPSFSQQLDAFTQSGHLGIAAHMNAGQDMSTALTTAEPQVFTFGHPSSSTQPASSHASAFSGQTETTNLESLLDDPTVQAMLHSSNAGLAPSLSHSAAAATSAPTTPTAITS